MSDDGYTDPGERITDDEADASELHEGSLTRREILKRGGVGAAAVVGAGFAASSAQARLDALEKLPPGVAEATLAIQSARKPITWKPPRGGAKPFNGAAARGQTLLYLPISTGAPIIQEVIAGMKDAASNVGVNIQSFDAKGSPSEVARAIELAIAQKVNAIETVSFDITLVSEPLRRAHEAGIKIIVNDRNPELHPRPLPEITSSLISLPWERAGKLLADWVIQDSGGKGRVLLIANTDSPGATDTGDAVMKEFGRLAPRMNVRRLGITFAEWSKLNIITRTELTKDPRLNYMIPVFDSMTLIMSPAVKAAGFAGKLQLVGYNGTVPVVQSIGSSNVVSCDIGNSNHLAGWADFDACLRVMANGPKIINEDVQMRVFDRTNIRSFNLKAPGDSWYGKTFARDYRAGYKKLWGVK